MMTWFRPKHDAREDRVRREAGQRHREVKRRAEKVTEELTDRRNRNHFTEALAALMRGHP